LCQKTASWNTGTVLSYGEEREGTARKQYSRKIKIPAQLK